MKKRKKTCPKIITQILICFNEMWRLNINEIILRTSFCSYARPAQPCPNRTRLHGPCIAEIAGD